MMPFGHSVILETSVKCLYIPTFKSFSISSVACLVWGKVSDCILLNAPLVCIGCALTSQGYCVSALSAVLFTSPLSLAELVLPFARSSTKLMNGVWYRGNFPHSYEISVAVGISQFLDSLSV